MKWIWLVFMLFIGASVFGQNTNAQEDSIRNLINQYPDYDSLKINLIFELAAMVEEASPSRHESLLMEANRQSKIGKHPYQLAKSSQLLGIHYFFQGDYEKAEVLLKEGAEVARANKFQLLLASILSDLGQIEDALQKDKLSLQHTLEAIEIMEEKKDFKNLIATYNNLGGFYYYRDKNKKALEYYTKAKDILLSRLSLRDNFNDWAVTESNIGWCYYYMGNLDDAIDQLKRAVDIHSKYDYYSYSSGNARANLASLYVEAENFDLAKIHARDGLDICTELDYLQGIGNANHTLGEIALAEGNYKEAAEAFGEALSVAEKLGNLDNQAYRTKMLSYCYSNMGNYKLAYNFALQSKTLNDSLSKLKSDAAFEDAITKYETEKKEAENALLQEQAKLKDLQLEQERQQARSAQERQWIIGGSIGLILVSGLFFLINRNRLKTRTNRQLELQRDEIAEQKKEITDSITYAKRIQNSFLPDETDFQIHFEESFLMYQPKDIVAGDFYILEEVGDYVYFSVADCTGHGVPGAMVSIVCSNAIRKVLHELNISDPGEILNHTRDIVIQQFARKGHTVNDGMDISFCRFNKKTMKLAWAGANNSLLVLRKGTTELEEIKPNKQPIGGYVTTSPFTTHELDINKGDTIYMSSDGYPDQFGGEKGKKYKYKRFKELLVRTSNNSLQKQKELISSEFWEWKQGMEQIDDVCVMGVRV
ncbi:MAG: tetratricopeptide repeat protein [Crocinitomicaceae bacterium]|nr:tetratricopeptide repeat protein [Crocinitomicaceae bacterium]